MMRPNHEFFCSVDLSPGFRNWVEMTCNMQQEGVGLVFLPRPASLVRAPVLPCAEAPLGESVVSVVCVCVCVCVRACVCVCVCALCGVC